MPTNSTPDMTRMGSSIPRVTIGKLGTWNKYHSPQHGKTGEQVMKMLLKTISTYLLETWTLCNNHVHQYANQLNLLNYWQATLTLYKQCNQLPPAAQEVLYHQPLDTILGLPASQAITAMGPTRTQVFQPATHSCQPSCTHQINVFFPNTNSAKWQSPTTLGSPVTLHLCGSYLYAIVLER